MIKIEDNEITMTRGDTLETTVEIFTKQGEPYIPSSLDRIRFALKKRYKDVEPLIVKEVPYDTMLLHLDPEDTKPLAFGDYVYDLELTTSDGFVDTFIDKKLFKITEEVY